MYLKETRVLKWMKVASLWNVMGREGVKVKTKIRKEKEGSSLKSGDGNCCNTTTTCYLWYECTTVGKI